MIARCNYLTIKGVLSACDLFVYDGYHSRKFKCSCREERSVPFGVFGGLVIQSVTCLVFSDHIMYFANQLRQI